MPRLTQDGCRAGCHHGRRAGGDGETALRAVSGAPRHISGGIPIALFEQVNLPDLCVFKSISYSPPSRESARSRSSRRPRSKPRPRAAKSRSTRSSKRSPRSSRSTSQTRCTRRRYKRQDEICGQETPLRHPRAPRERIKPLKDTFTHSVYT